jgi:hypothetical protein
MAGDYSLPNVEEFGRGAGGLPSESLPRDFRGRFASPAEFKEADALAATDLAELILFSGLTEAALEAKARAVRDYWKSIAPLRGDKDTKGRDSGLTVSFSRSGSPSKNNPFDYRESIEMKSEGGYFTVGSTLYPLAEFLEYGSVHNPEYGYGARTLAYFGGDASQPNRNAERGELNITGMLFMG